MTEDLDRFGYGPDLAADLAEKDPSGRLRPGRVCEDRGGALLVRIAEGAVSAQISGRLSYLAGGAEDLPAVGDWVAADVRVEDGSATVHHVLARRTALVRKTPDRALEAQVLAANVDVVLVVASANQDFNPRRIERMLLVAADGGARGVVVLSKLDLCDERAPLLAAAAEVAAGAPVVALSARTSEGIEALAPHLEPRRTAVLLGSSGVGKSTLVNRLVGRELLATREIRTGDDKGRHATSHRQLVALESGALLIDTPGLREIGLFDEGDGLDKVFPELEALAQDCRFRDCGHRGEPGCAVAAALEDGRLDAGRYANHQKLEREARAARERREAQGRHERRQRMKKFAKTIRSRPTKRDP